MTAFESTDRRRSTFVAIDQIWRRVDGDVPWVERKQESERGYREVGKERGNMTIVLCGGEVSQVLV